MSRLCWICAKRHHTDLLPAPAGRLDEDEHDAFVHIFMIAIPDFPDPKSAEFEAAIVALANAVGRFGGCVAAKARAKARKVN